MQYLPHLLKLARLQQLKLLPKPPTLLAAIV